MTIIIRKLVNKKMLILVNNKEKLAIYFDGTKSPERAVSEIKGVTDKEKDRILGSLYVALRSNFYVEEKPIHIRKSGTVSVMIRDEDAGAILMSRDNNRWMKFTSLDSKRKDLIKEGFNIMPEYVAMRGSFYWKANLFSQQPESLDPNHGLMIELDSGGITEMGKYKDEVVWTE